jgi:hypothetical protein
MSMNAPANFRWDGYGPVIKMKERLFAMSDAEIIEGAQVRAQ